MNRSLDWHRKLRARPPLGAAAGGAGRLATQFDGVTDAFVLENASYGSDPTGFTFVATVRIDSGDGNTRSLFYVDTAGGNQFWLAFRLNSDDKFDIWFRNSGGTKLQCATAGTYAAGAAWRRLYFTGNVASGELDVQLYVDGTDDSDTPVTHGAGMIDLTNSGLDWSAARRHAGGSPTIHAPITWSEVWMHAAYLDGATYLTKFFSGGTNVGLGDTGELPLGAAPNVGYWPDGDFTSNASDGAAALGAFTTVGTPSQVTGPNG